MALVFLDLDGTLLDNGKPAPRAIEAVRLLHANGHDVILATGRVPYLIDGLDRQLGIPSYIAANGNYIKHDDEIVLENYIPDKVLKRILKASDEWGFDLVMESVDAYVAYRKETTLVDEFSDVFSIEHPRVDRNYPFEHKILSLVVFEDEFIPRLREAFPELAFNRSNRFGYDVNPSGGLKEVGMAKLIRHLGVDPETVYAVGDGFNDIGMIREARHGIAMGNAHESVKAVAEYVTSDVTQAGVYDAMKHYRLI